MPMAIIETTGRTIQRNGAAQDRAALRPPATLVRRRKPLRSLPLHHGPNPNLKSLVIPSSGATPYLALPVVIVLPYPEFAERIAFLDL